MKKRKLIRDMFMSRFVQDTQLKKMDTHLDYPTHVIVFNKTVPNIIKKLYLKLSESLRTQLFDEET